MDREGFISHLTKNGAFSKEEAEQLADEEFGGKTPSSTSLSPYDETNAAKELSRVQSELTGQRSPAHKGLGDLWEGLSTGEKAAVVGGLGLLGVSSAIGLGTVGKKIKDRLISKPQEIDRTIDIPMDKTVAPAPATEAPPKSLLTEQEEQMLSESERNRAAKKAEALAKTPIQPPVAGLTPVAPYDQGRMANMMAAQEMFNPLGGQASAYTEPLRPAETTVEPTKVEPPKNKGGRPKGAKTLTAEERAAQEAAKGINMYRNLFGFETSNPTSPKSLAAIEATNRFISESFEGKIPGSRDPFLNPSTDIGASGKKFYSGTPEGYRNNYIPWLQKNLNTLPPETQSHILHSMTKGQTRDLEKILKGLGVAATGLGAAGIAFADTPKERQAAAKEFAFDLATGIPLTAAVGGPAAAVGAMALGSSGLNKREDEQLARIKEKERQAALLGSPYASTEWAKQQRKGIPPPR